MRGGDWNPTGAPKGRISGLPTTSSGKPFQLWAQGLFCTERSLARRLKSNSFYPFMQQQPNGGRAQRAGRGQSGGGALEPPTQAGPAGARLGGGTAGWILSEVLGPTWGGLFRARALALPPRAASRSPVFSRVLGAPPLVFVLEYYLDTLWKGTLLFIVCILLISFGLVSEVQKQETWGFPAYGVGVGLWLMISSLPRRRLVLNHALGVYHFSIQGRTVCQGPMHLVYVRLALNSDAYRRCFFQLVLCGHKLEPLVLVQLSERYEQMEYLGRYIARKLNINYFDCLATSYRHVVRHWPLGSTFSPGIVLRKTGTYDEGNSQWDPDV
ncbi:cation channel sperm-associated auxiliary subunit TMEM249 [Ovis aries]|nr:cation channel sperm-associated auxiliary subunit TMEM249 [Ovis aries]